jgi:ABC-type oligopeptide transport system substrate-binding subunit
VAFKPFDNKLVRQAINYALDPYVMLKHIYDGHGAVVDGPLGSNWVGYDPKIKILTIPVEPASFSAKRVIPTVSSSSFILLRTAISKAKRFAKSSPTSWEKSASKWS